MSSLNLDLEEIRQIVLKSNNDIKKISTKVKEQNHDESEEFDFADIKQAFQNNLQSLKNKLNSLPTSDIEDESIPVFHSTLNQLEPLLEKIRSDPIDDDVFSILRFPRYTEQSSSTIIINENSQESIPILRMDRHPLERNLESEQDTEMNHQLNFHAQLSKDLKFMEKQARQLKTIADEYYQRKLRKFFTKLQSKHDNDCESYKQRKTIYTDLKEYSKYCVELYKYCVESNQSLEQLRKDTNSNLKVTYRRKLKDDLQFRQCFHIFLVQFQKDLFHMVLSESKDYIPRSSYLIDCLKNDKYYNLYVDQEQLGLIYEFVRNIYYSASLEKLHNCISIKTPYLKLIVACTNDPIHANYYINELKEFYLVFVRDSILSLKEEDQEIIESDETVQSLFDEMKKFYEQKIKIIQNSEKVTKNLFIRQFRGTTWDEKLINDRTVSSQNTDEEESTSTQEDTADSDEHFDAENNLMNTEGSPEDSVDLFQQSEALKKKKPSLKLYLKKSIELLNKSIAIDKSLIDSSIRNNQEKSNAKDQLRRKIEFRALIYLDMANKYKFPCFEKFSCFNQSKYDFIEYDKQMTDETNVQFNKKNFIHLFRQAFAVDDISSMKLYNNVLQINPYFFEAQYQKLLKFYELNDCEISHIHETFTELVKSNKPIVDLFEALIDVKVCHDDKKNGQTSVFFNKIFKIEINDENEELYIQFSKTKYSTEIKLNKKKQLIKLLKHGQKHIIIVKTNPDKLSKLKCHLSNLDFNDLLTTASNSIEGTFAHLLRSDNPVEDLFDILIPIYLKQCHDRNNRKSLTFFDKILKIKVKNNQNKSLYLHFSKTQYSDQVKYNNEEQLINLLKYGSGGMIKMKKTSNKSSKLKYQLSNSDFEQFIRSLINRIDKQEPKFLKLIQLFKELESVNENEYQKLDETFRIILPETRFTLIKCTNNSNHCQTICEISRSIEEFESLNNPKKLSILQLKFQRAKIYRKNLYFNLEELEFFDILNYQKTNRDHNPMIYYRLSYLSKQKGDLQMSIHYINLASKKYNEKSNKKIFKEIEKFKSDLLKLENVQTDDLAFFDKNKMNLFKIFNLITKFNFQSYSYVTLGFHLFTDELINCLFYHLIEEHDVEEYLKYHDNTLTKTYRELHEESVSEEEFINKFNEKFKTNFKCFFVEEGIDSRMLTYTNNQVPIVLIKTSNFYTTIKEVNYFMFLTVLLTTYDAKSDLKSVCSIFLNNEISKNILTDAKENQNIERFIQAMIECKNMKVFNEEIIYYLKTDNYNQYCLDFWSLIADLDYNLVLTDILNDFKELFIESIEEYRTDKEKEHKSALELIDDIIEENARTQKFWNLLNKLKEEIIKSLSIYENVSSKSDKRKKLMEIIISTDEIDDKFQEIISVDCFQIDLNFTDASEEQSFYQYIKTSQESEIPFQLLSLIQDALSAPEINIQNSVIIVKGYNIFFSDIIENIQTKIPDLNIKEVQFYGTNVFIDMSLNNECWYGINLIIGSDIIDFIKDDKLNTKITINLTGKKGSDGNNAKHQPNATRESEDGLDGLPGENGQVGGNGGNIYFIVKKQLKRRENIEKLTTSGGDGGQGGNGGNGGDGQNGKIGDDATEGNGLPTLYRGYYLSRGKPGTRGGDGGQGGDAGFGGFGGHPGIVYIEENQTKINDALNPDKIESIDKSNISAEHGEHGEGGKSGVGGSDGLDVLEYRYHNFGKKKIYYGYIKITKVQWGFFTYTVEFIYEERPKKKPGISGNQGKAADQQINSGKIRRKSEDKEKSNEQQIKNQLNQLIHNNNERTNNISNNITHSIYLLQDQKEELLNERDTQVKTHQLSNSLLKKAFATAHKSFKLNMENTKSKTENNIIRTPDTNANHDNKSTIQSELSVDEHPKENIQFKTCDPIIQRLTESYNPEKDRLIKFLDENIKEKDDKIILLKRKGKHILFKIDIDSMNDSFITDRNEINQINLLHLNGTRLSTMDGDLINQDFSLLRNRYKNALYYCNSKQHAPFVLKQYLDDLKKLPKEKKSFLRTRHKLNQLNVDTFINEICLEYGNEELIKWKMTKFAQIIKSDGLQGTKDFDSFDMNNFIKQNDFPIDEVNAYETHLTNLFLNEQNLEIFKEISRILIESKLSIKRIERSQNFLTLLFNLLQSKKIFKEFKLNDCTPIYHPKNEPINMYVIEQLMYQFLQSKDKNLELLARIFNCFRKIVEKESDEILCKKKIENFLEFISECLLLIRVDSNQGSLLHKMKRDLNFIQINCSSDLFHNLFDQLELILLIRIEQFKQLENYTNKIEFYFQQKQNDIDQDIQIINHIKKNRKVDIFRLFKQHLSSNQMNFENITEIEEFRNSLYLTEEFKEKIKIILKDFYNYLKNSQEYTYICVVENIHIFIKKLKLFLKEQKKKTNMNLDSILINKQECESIIHLLCKNMSLQTNINFLKQIDTSKDVDTSVFVQNVKDLYEQLRGQKLEDMNKQQEGNSDEIIDLSQSNYNEKIGFIYLISGQLDNAKEMQIKNGNKIVITKNMENQYMIYFRDNQNFEVRQHLLDKEALLRKLNGLKFDTEVMLSKETDKDIYKNIYEEIESKNGFTEYSTEQIEFFNNLKEFVYEKLDLLKNKLEPNTYQYIANEINYVFDSESPDLWLCRTHFILYNLNIIIDLQAKFKNELELPTSIETLRSDLKDLLTNPVLKDIIEHLLNGKEDGIIIIFFKLLSIFDHLLIKITKKESNTSVKDQIKQIGENLCNKFQLKDDLRDKILYEIIMKNNQILKRYYFDEILNIYEEKRQHISSYIDSSPLYQNKDKCKESFQTHFQDLINNGYLTLFDYIDEIYVTSSNKLKISMTDTIYSELMQMIKIFFDKINANSEFKSFIDETVLFRNRLQNYCVILTSELNNIPEIAPILNEFKINMMTFEKCSIRRNDQDRTTQDQNEIILSKISEKEFQIVYRRLQDNKIAPFILKKDQDAELFLLMNETITIGDQTKFEKLYSMINAKNGSIYKNNIFFDEKIFIEIFINRILKHKSEFSIETLTTYFNSFEIILKNSTINFNILLSLDEFFQNLIKKESNEQFIELFNQFSLLIDKEYENLIGNLENDFANLSVGIKRKNRILNITFNYLSKCLQEKTIETIEFKKNDILNTTLEIKNILQIHKLQLSDILQCYDELNVALILAPLSCLKIYKQQLDLLNLEIRLFIEIVDCSLQTHFNQFNNELKQTKSVDHQLIFNLLKIVTENSTLILAENYQSIMKRILLNFEMTNDEFNWPMLQKIENQITKCEKIQSIRMDYRMFIVKITKFKLISKYKDELTRYEEEKKKLNDLIQKIVDLFWSNISNSDLLNKEREKTYVILNIEKLLKLCNTDFANAESILIDLQTKIRGLQKNSDKKQFTNDIHMYLNKKINSELYKFPNIILPINLDDNIKNRITYILGNNYTYEDSTAVFKEFSVLFEESIDKFDKNSSKYNEFFESFNKIFQYFSWRLLEYNPTSKQDVLNEAIERFTASMQRFKDIISSENIEQLRVEYNHFYEFENIFHLRTHDNQLQQELNMLQSDYQVKRDIIDQIKEGWLKNISNCLSVANPLITERGELYDDQIPQLFLKNIIDLQNLKSKENSEVLNGTTDNATETEVTEEGEEEEVQISTEQISNAKIPLEMKFSVLNELSCQMINKEEQWNEKKGLIEKFDLIKEKLFDEYLKTMFEQRTDRSLIFDTFKNSIQIKHIKEIITQTAVDEWNREMCDLSVDLFLVSLLKFYNFDCDNLKSRFISIEKSVKDKQTNDDDDTLTIWQTEITEKKNAMEIINYILAYSKENVDSFNLQTTLFGSIKQFINDVNSIQILKSSIDTLYFFVGYENFMRLAAVLQMKLINSSPTKLNLEKLAEISSLLSSTNNFNRAIKFLENFHLENWLLYLNYDQIENDLNMIFNRYFDQMNFNDLKIENLNRVDEFIESEFYQTKTMYDQSFENISKTLKLIKLNQKINVSDKEMFFRFLRSRFIYELKKDSNCLINFNDLQKIFLKYLTDTTIIRKIINSLTWKLDDENPINDQLIIEDIHSKTFNSLLPYLIRFWIIKQLELDKKALEDERTKIIQYFEIIKTLYSEEKMFQLIGVIQEKCKDKKIISQNVIDLLINMSNNEWLLNEDILNILRTTEINEWGKRIEDYMEKKRSIERDFRELINLMKEDRNSLNKLINDYLNSENILSDLQALISKRKEKIDFNKPVENWTIADIQEWAKKTRGNRLLLSKEAVQNTIVVVSQGINLFRKYYPRDTQILALWLFLNPDLNNTSMGCLAQISTGEGKSIIVAALAAIKALGCHRIDVMTSSNVLAIRDAKEFQSFFEMFGLQVSNNCDMFCEQGDGKQSAEEIRKLRYYNSSGPVDIIYGECSCFERDILLTEFNKNDRNQNIIGQRLSKNSVSSVIIDEVDSMLLDKANMVLYLSHNTDTLKSLERIFISIWQTINQPTLDAVRDHMIDDDLIESVTDIILDQIDQKAIEIPEYDSRNCDYINMRLFTERRMPVWIRSAFHVRDMIPNDTYIISRDKSDKSSKSEVQITVMDKDTGTEQLSTRWSNGVHQFLQLKHMRRFTPESLKAGFISNMSFFKRYQNHIVGLTGSLGSIDEQFLLNKVYQLRFFELPRFKQELFRELKGTMTTSQDTWLESIKNALDREIKSKLGSKDRRRAVLIICENVKNVLVLKEYLASSYPNAKDYKSAYEDFKIDQLNPGDIIIATNLAGRGTDLETSDKLEENGGLHVITTYLPSNIRIEMQAFGRTARKGNKGTGEYIIISQYGLSIETLKQLRNCQEKERLDSFLINDLPKIQIEEDLLQGFTDDNQLSCIGFTKLYQNIEKKLSSDRSVQYHGYQYKQFQLNSLKNRWAFWLDSMTESINMINVIGKKTIIEKFNEFQSAIEKDVEANTFEKLIIEPCELIKLGKYYRDCGNWWKALICYQQAGLDRFYASANYYTSSCRQNINYVNGINSKREFKHSLILVKQSIEKEMQFLNNAAQVAFEIGEKNRKLGLANYGNEYDKQVKEKSTIWNIFSDTVINALGTSIDPKDLTANKYLSDEKQAEKLFDSLKKNKDKYIKSSRITKKTINSLELPSIFNNKKTNDSLINYLRKKSEIRCSNDLDELNEEIFKKDLKKSKIFLPDLNSFIDLIEKENGFIEQIENKEEDELFLFQSFNEENLNKEKFPHEILNIKKSLFDWLKEISEEKGMTGTKNDILIKLNNFLISKNQQNVTEDQWTKIYGFLIKHSCLQKLKQYLVKKDKIMKPIDGDYKYFNLYNFEHHYTDEFEKFDSVLRQNFLKIFVIQEDPEDGESYITLKETINTSDFNLCKTKEEAINYLWSYLRSTPLIKPPRINIPLESLKEVNRKRKGIEKEIKLFLEREIPKDKKNELEEAIKAVFNIIDQTIGDLKKMPDDKTITSYLQIKTSCFLDNKKRIPEALDEFIDLAFDVIFQLQEKKDPPQWYEIAAVIALGLLQIAAGVLATAFIPFAGQLIGEFLISTGCDDILFGISCAMSGEFSWEKYWEHKKQSMKTSAISAVVFVSVSFVKNARRLQSCKKAWAFQKLKGAQKLRTAAAALNTTANVSKYVGKEIAKTLVKTGLAELASMGINKVLDTLSNTYESELHGKITDSLKSKWNIIETEMLELFRVTEGKNSMKIIDDCINRKLQNLSEDGAFKNFTRRCGPVIQGLGKALADVNGTKGKIINALMSYAPTLIGLGISVNDIICMISSFIQSLTADLKDARKSLKKTNQEYQLTEENETDFKKYKKEKFDQISSCLSENFNQKLKSGILAPVLNFASNMMISRGIEYVAGTDRVEQLANTFELIHAASNSSDTKPRYTENLAIYLAEARHIDITLLNIDPKNIYPENGDGENLEKLIDTNGNALKVFYGKDGKFYVQIPSPKKYCEGVLDDKPAGIYEQKTIDVVLECEVIKGKVINGEQQCTLKRRGGSDVKFVIKDNGNGKKHAELLIDGKSISIDTNRQNKNDCYYVVVLVANEVSQGKSFEEARNILDDRNAVLNLRKNVSSVMKNDPEFLKKFEWANRTDRQVHYNSLVGSYTDSDGKGDMKHLLASIKNINPNNVEEMNKKINELVDYYIKYHVEKDAKSKKANNSGQPSKRGEHIINVGLKNIGKEIKDRFLNEVGIEKVPEGLQEALKTFNVTPRSDISNMTVNNVPQYNNKNAIEFGRSKELLIEFSLGYMKNLYKQNNELQAIDTTMNNTKEIYQTALKAITQKMIREKIYVDQEAWKHLSNEIHKNRSKGHQNKSQKSHFAKYNDAVKDIEDQLKQFGHSQKKT